jgi:transcription termination factor Rho
MLKPVAMEPIHRLYPLSQLVVAAVAVGINLVDREVLVVLLVDEIHQMLREQELLVKVTMVARRFNLPATDQVVVVQVALDLTRLHRRGPWVVQGLHSL